jgi:Fe-S-cluster containining protein
MLPAESGIPMNTFVCQHCGACCRWPGSVLLAAADIAALAAALGLSEGEFIATHTMLARNRAQLTLKESPDGSCEFLDAAGLCRMYPARPGQCRDFPQGWRVEGCPGLRPA